MHSKQTNHKKSSAKAELFFADASVEALEAQKTLPAKFIRILKKFNLPKKVKGKSVTIKMHLGDDRIEFFILRIVIIFIQEVWIN